MSEITDLIGIPFSEMKCWDLVREYEHRQGKEIPDYTELMIHGIPDGKEYVHPIKEPEKDCICLFGLQSEDIDHAGIYLGNNKLLHATEGCGVCIERFSKYRSKLKGLYK